VPAEADKYDAGAHASRGATVKLPYNSKRSVLNSSDLLSETRPRLLFGPGLSEYHKAGGLGASR
jgi:hypothetical protein